MGVEELVNETLEGGIDAVDAALRPVATNAFQGFDIASLSKGNEVAVEALVGPVRLCFTARPRGIAIADWEFAVMDVLAAMFAKAGCANNSCIRAVFRRAKADQDNEDGKHDKLSAVRYYEYYAKLRFQECTLRDRVRTETFQTALAANAADIDGKTVLECGAGVGMISIFAAQCHAATVYCVEASNLADSAKKLMEHNKIKNVQVLKCLVEDAPIPRQSVDLIVSSWFSTFLFAERGMGAMCVARDLYLKPGGKMFPSECDFCVAPFSDESLLQDRLTRSPFWGQKSWYFLDLSCLKDEAIRQDVRRPSVEYVDPSIIMAPAHIHRFDMYTAQAAELKRIKMPFQFVMAKTCLIHGLASWFALHFEGSKAKVTLNTEPAFPVTSGGARGTNWFQARYLLEKPIAVNEGQQLVGFMEVDCSTFNAHAAFIELRIEGTDVVAKSPVIDLRDMDPRHGSLKQFPPNYATMDSPKPHDIVLPERIEKWPMFPVGALVTVAGVSYKFVGSLADQVLEGRQLYPSGVLNGVQFFRATNVDGLVAKAPGEAHHTLWERENKDDGSKAPFQVSPP